MPLLQLLIALARQVNKRALSVASPLQPANLEPEVRHIRRVSDRLMALIALGLLFLVAAVLLARSTDHIVVAEPPEGALTSSRTLAFSDGTQGRITISDDVSGEIIRQLEAGEGSFIRGVVRSLVRARHQQGVFSQAGFQLNLYEDGRLQLLDPLTNEVIDLVAFGPTNVAEFAALLPVDQKPPLIAGGA